MDAAEVTRKDVIAALARKHPTRFACAVNNVYKPAWFHWVIGDYLKDVAFNKIKRLIINLPPRHGKSTICSRKFPPWYLGQSFKTTLGLPLSIIAASYNSTLARSFGRSARNIVASPIYSEIFDVYLNRHSGAAAADWSLDNENTYSAAGVNAGITGLGASIFIIDDPIKDRRQANSATYREALKDWYKEVALTRLTPDGAMVIIMTRWHYDDLVGWLLREWKEEAWTLLKFPAIKTDENFEYDNRKIDEALWPEMYDKDKLKKRAEEMGALEFNCIYQQDAKVSEGAVINIQDFIFDFELDELPKFERVIASWDTAFESKTTADYSVGQTWGAIKGDYYLIDQVRGRWRFPELKKRMHENYKKHKHDSVLIEAKASGKDLIYELIDNTDMPIIPIEPIGDKISRAAAVSGRIEAGRVHLPKSSPWINHLLTEIEYFPVGGYDDQVDTLTQAIRWLSRYGVDIIA